MACLPARLRELREHRDASRVFIYPYIAHRRRWEYYAASDALQLDTKTNCNKDIVSGMILPRKWRFPCPKLYFSFDAETLGTRGGPAGTSITFEPSEILNSAFQLPNPDGSIKAYFNLGHYPNTNYCFPDPEGCEHGVVFAFWLNVILLTLNNKPPSKKDPL